MSLTGNGKYVCDRDGVDVGNGGVLAAVVVSDLDPDNPGHVRNLHFCRDEVDEDGKVVRKGCANKVLSASNMKHYNEERESDGAQ